LLITIMVFIIAILFLPIPSLKRTNMQEYFIAHAGGEIDGFSYTNSVEAVINSINNEFKYIELDISLTTDSQLVCMHSPSEFIEMTNLPDSIMLTADVFNRQTILEKYTPLSLSKLVDLQKRFNFVLVLDKTSNPQLLDNYLADIRQHVMVESFSVKDYFELYDLGYIPMLSLYYNGYLRPMVSLCSKYNIKWISTTVQNYRDLINIHILKFIFGVKVAAYTTVPTKFLKYVGSEIDLLYVDYNIAEGY